MLIEIRGEDKDIFGGNGFSGTYTGTPIDDEYIAYFHIEDITYIKKTGSNTCRYMISLKNGDQISGICKEDGEKVIGILKSLERNNKIDEILN